MRFGCLIVGLPGLHRVLLAIVGRAQATQTDRDKARRARAQMQTFEPSNRKESKERELPRRACKYRPLPGRVPPEDANEEKRSRLKALRNTMHACSARQVLSRLFLVDTSIRLQRYVR